MGANLVSPRASRAAVQPSFLRLRRGLTLKHTVFTGVVVAVGALELVRASPEAAAGCALVSGFVVAWTQRMVWRGIVPHTKFLPLMRALAPLAAPLMAFAILGVLDLLDVLPLSLPEVALLCVLGALSTMLLLIAPRSPSGQPTRIGVVGSAGTADDLRAELQAREIHSFVVVGHILWEDRVDDQFDRRVGPAPLGTRGELAETVFSEQLDLLLIAPSVPRMTFFEEVESTCSHADVRVLELASFYERVFGHVALRAINAAWFQWVMHPRYSPRIPPAKRSLDLFIASLVALVAAPFLAAAALAIKLEGGPAFYRQTRIGEGGRQFQILKLRSMRPADADAPARWSSADDDRVTSLGRFLRRTHLDELPQIVNVLKGDMSIVGPRPEQPGFVESLEESVHFYSRRHTVRPGVTGWAQVRCGYAGSHEGTLWKLSHDLYYLKHRSVTFDLLILGETVRTLVADRQFPTDLYLPPFVHQPSGPAPGLGHGSTAAHS
jgi:exopolysaccharide biosynthesis polyprenyl glycosylphosphotransferase